MVRHQVEGAAKVHTGLISSRYAGVMRIDYIRGRSHRLVPARRDAAMVSPTTGKAGAYVKFPRAAVLPGNIATYILVGAAVKTYFE